MDWNYLRAEGLDHNVQYRVVVNHKEQYSIWPADRETPLGWKDAGYTGTKQGCLAHLEELWIALRPLSLRQMMEDAKQSGF